MGKRSTGFIQSTHVENSITRNHNFLINNFYDIFYFYFEKMN